MTFWRRRTKAFPSWASNPSTQPLSRVITTTELDCDGSLGDEGIPLEGSNGVEGGSLTSIGYVDGLGRARAALSTGPDAAGARRWVRSGLSRFSRKGEVIEAYQPDFFGSSDASFSAVVAINYAMPSSRAVYDAFGRARYSFAEDGALNVTSYHALSTDVCDPLDNDPSSPHVGTCTTARTDGHGRVIDQILRNRPIDNPFAGMERHRLWTYYRGDGSVRWLVRSQTGDENPRPDLATALGASDPHVSREFIYDSVARRIASNDPDTDDPSGSAGSRTWRYLFNRVGDLVAVRDPRGCGQNFYYDVGGRLLGEDYVTCGEAQSTVAESPAYDVAAGAIALGPTANPVDVDVCYFYDEYPEWIDAPMGSAGVAGRATGVADRGQRSVVAYDNRGNAIWTARQMALISARLTLTASALTDGRPTFTEGAPSAGTVVYDDLDVHHTYIRTASVDHAARPTAMTLPADPDWDPMGVDPSPSIVGNLEYDRRGLPARALLTVGALDPIPVVAAIEYLRDGLVSHIEYGDLGSAPVIESHTEYDVRRRPVRMTTTREPTAGAMAGELGEVSVVHDQRLEWDTVSNLTALVDERLPSEWPDEFRPQTVEITHDSLYRVVGALFHYSTELGDDEDDDASDWRANANAPNDVNPMRPNPADMVGSPSGGNRVRSLVWEWDWLGNMTEWTDDAQQFYERSIGDIQNGQDLASGPSAVGDERPSALYLSSNLDLVGEGGGWVELDYGAGGNVTQLTVHGECSAMGTLDCRTTGRPEAVALSCAWSCAAEQHFEYRWDELNRIVEAHRWDRSGPGNPWTHEARQRYRYDGANQRTVKESFDTSVGDSRVALYVYPGDFERRGVTRGSLEYESVTMGYETETQYVVAGARLVWDHTTTLGAGMGDLDRNRRLTMGVTDLIQTTAASVDLLSGELLEVSTYYPNGARETLRTNAGAAVPLEPMGFTGKEADEDVGLVYFGERYLLARLGRWASPDPLHVHASGGGEALNSYHYVSGNLLQARDPLGLCGEEDGDPCTGANSSDMSGGRGHPPGLGTAERGASEAIADHMFEEGYANALLHAELERFISGSEQYRSEHITSAWRHVAEGRLVERSPGSLDHTTTFDLAPAFIAAHAERMGRSADYRSGFEDGSFDARHDRHVRRMAERDAASPLGVLATATMFVLQFLPERMVNMDTSALIGLSTSRIEARSLTRAAVGTDRMVVTDTALVEFWDIAMETAGDAEMDRVFEVVRSATFVRAAPSPRAARLMSVIPSSANDFAILGTGDTMGIPTITFDGDSLRQAASQGVEFDTIHLVGPNRFIDRPRRR